MLILLNEGKNIMFIYALIRSASAFLHEMRALMRSSRFTVLFFGETFSDLGNRCYEVVLIWLITGLTGSTLLISTILTAEYIPFIFLQVFGGIWADRRNPYKTLLISDILRTIVTCIFAVLVVLGYISIADIFIFSIFYGLVSAFFNPSMGVLFTSMISSDDYNAYSILTQLLGHFTTLLGPALGGYLIAKLNIGLALAFDAFTFAISFIIIIWIYQNSAKYDKEEKVEQIDQSASNKGVDVSSLLAGFHFLWQEKGVLAVTLLASLTNGLNNVEAVLVPILARHDLKVTAEQFGLLASFLGAGAIIGALCIGLLGKRIHRRVLTICLSIAAFGVTIIALGAAQTIWQLYGAYFVLGITFATVEVVSSTFLLHIIPEDIRGRAFSVIGTLATGLNPLGFMFAGLLGYIWGARVGLWIGGAAITILSIFTLLLPAVRSLDCGVHSEPMDTSSSCKHQEQSGSSQGIHI